MNARVVAVVPIYGRPEVVHDCLAALAASDIDQVICVDDGSPGGLGSKLKVAWPAFEFILLPKNKGFAVAANRGMVAALAAHADIIVLLNSDVIVVPDLAETCRHYLSEPTVGSGAPILLRRDGLIDSFGITLDCLCAGFVRYHGVSQGRVPLGSRTPLLGPYGAAAVYRAAALEEVGLFDERIFMYGEELDLNLRLYARGWSTVEIPLIIGSHVGGATIGLGSSRQRELNGFARGFIMRKYAKSLGVGKLALAIFVEFLICVRSMLIARDLASTRGRVRGWRDGSASELDVPLSSAEWLSVREGLEVRAGHWRRLGY